MPRFALILVFLFLLCGGCRQDAAQWKFAKGLNEYEAGNLDQAIELLQESLKLDPSESKVKLRLARLLAENCQGDLGLAWCDEVLDQSPSNAEARNVRVVCLQYLGRFDEAFREYQKVVAGKIDKPAEHLNNLAYFRALASRELDKAQRQISQAIEKYERNKPWANLKGVPIHVQGIVSAGLLTRQVGGREHVVGPLNDLIIQHEDQWNAYDAKLDGLLRLQTAAEETAGVTVADFQSAVDVVSNRIKNIEGSLALLLATRSLMSEDAGDTVLADRDRLWLKRIGHDPEDVFGRLPSDLECWGAVQVSTVYLDTRGFVLAKQPWATRWIDPLGQESSLPVGSASYLAKESNYADALFDLDVAISAAEVNRLVVNSSLLNQMNLDLDAVGFHQQQAGKLIAVLRYHRLKAHEKAGQMDLAAADQRRIESLGFEADCSLF
jgi:tetratricopeptide (TPR) repeat protein